MYMNYIWTRYCNFLPLLTMDQDPYFKDLYPWESNVHVITAMRRRCLDLVKPLGYTLVTFNYKMLWMFQTELLCWKENRIKGPSQHNHNSIILTMNTFKGPTPGHHICADWGLTLDDIKSKTNSTGVTIQVSSFLSLSPELVLYIIQFFSKQESSSWSTTISPLN
jgi:hypothetical protein